MSESTDFKDTLNLPVTDFPMRGNMAKREPEFLEKWESSNIWKEIDKNAAEKPLFVLHDGPPYANGDIHIGHILNKVLKDIIIKFKSMTGHRTVYVPGWDCHGLPIELQVDKKLGKKKVEMSQVEIRQACHEFAMKYVDTQREQFKRLGILGNWDEPYLTLNKEYESAIVDQIAQFAREGYLYKGKKPVHWCASCQTALAEAEVEHKPHTSPSIFVKFEYLGDKGALHPSLADKKVSFVIWTTTPWTMPANLAIALNPRFTYEAIEHQGEVLILAKDLVESVTESCEIKEFNRLCDIDVSKVEREACQHPLFERTSLMVFADYVSLDAGTGCVHTAPGHGQDDYVTGQKYGLDTLAPVDGRGVYTAEAHTYQGQHVFKANAVISEDLNNAGALLNPLGAKIDHSYPHCWRCKKPIIFRATPQWFAKLDHNGLREKSLKVIDETKWIPAFGHDRIYGMVENRPDWCLSRQRLWGVPIPALNCTSCDESFIDADVARHVAGVFQEKGSDAWYTEPVESLVPEGTECPQCSNNELQKENNIVDVWFESGVSWAAVCRGKEGLWPIDLYLEGSDQHRGWFHSALLTSVATTQKAPYKEVLTHGFVVDQKGQPYSKSLKNYIPPSKVINQKGAEIYRLWTAYVDYRHDMPFSETILNQLGDSYRKIRNTARFILGNLHGFQPSGSTPDLATLSPLDAWAMQRLKHFVDTCQGGYASYDLHQVYRSIISFCGMDLSSFYLDIVKDKLYCDNGQERQKTQEVLYQILRTLATVTAPILSFTAEDIWQYVPKQKGDPQSVLALQFPEYSFPVNTELDEQIETLRQLRDKALKEIEPFRAKKHHPLDAQLNLTLDKDTLAAVKAYEERDSIADFFIVSKVETQEGKEIAIQVLEAPGVKCPRCWKRSEGTPGASHPDLCGRCASITG